MTRLNATWGNRNTPTNRVHFYAKVFDIVANYYSQALKVRDDQQTIRTQMEHEVSDFNISTEESANYDTFIKVIVGGHESALA